MIGQLSKTRWLLLGIVAAVTVWSAVDPYDRATWWLEALPVLVGLPLVVYFAPRFPLTTLLFVLLCMHGVILVVGGHYTYANVPIGFWVQDALDLSRNHYDRLGHIAQGFVPAILMREILLRTSPLQPGKWLFVIVTSICLAFSAFYEMLEWWAALIMGQGAEAFLGTQGDEWDTQWDMFLALCGAMTAQWLFARLHDRQLGTLLSKSAQKPKNG